MSAEEIERVLITHAGHCGSGAGNWFAECLAYDCSWASHGNGTLVDATNAHRRHVAEVIAGGGFA